MNKKNEKLQNDPPTAAMPAAEPRPAHRIAARAAPTLRFTPTAWAKLLFLRDLGHTEIGGFAITPAEDLLLVQEFATVQQRVTATSVSFDDNAVADFFDQQIDRGLKPQQFLRIWVHSHPGDSASPSSTDEETFARVFGRSDWALMFIIARSGKTYARLRFNAGPGGHLQIPVQVDYRQPFTASDHDAWKREYKSNIHAEPVMSGIFGLGEFDAFDQELLHAEQLELADQDLPWGLWG